MPTLPAMARLVWVLLLASLWAACSQERNRSTTDGLPGDPSSGGSGGIPWGAGGTGAAGHGAGGAAGHTSGGAGGAGGHPAGGAGGEGGFEEPPNPIVIENRLPGDPDWGSGRGALPGTLEAYADRVSAHPGDRIPIHVSSDQALDVRWTLYRLGWYGGAGARQLRSGSLGLVGKQPSCPVQAGTGLIRCSWQVTAEIPIPADALSGLYLIKLERSDGLFHKLPLVLEGGSASPILFQASVTTWQAYNAWGGTSLYVDHTQTTSLGRAVEVSFDRPFIEGFGAGQLLRWEVHFAQFLERYGYDVTYTTNLSISPSLLAGRKAFLSVGHDEYWSLAERDALEAARDAGTSLFFFSANTSYWKMRLDDPDERGVPRTMVCWKADGHRDPVQGAERTGLWRSHPISRAEHRLIGVMYESWMRLSHAWVVADGSHWLYAGTGLETGDSLPRLVGYEYDRTFPGGPAGLEVVARSPVLDVLGVPGVAEATVYQTASGAWVFGAGTIEWSWGLGRPGFADPRVERMTANLLEKAGVSIPQPPGLLELPEAPPFEGPGAAAVHTVARNLPAISSVAAHSGGAWVASDPREHRILWIDATGAWTPLAGGGGAGNETDVPGSRARFNQPTSLIIDSRGNIIVADTGNHCIRRIAADPPHAVVDLAGRCGHPGFQEGSESEARFVHPMGLALRGGDHPNQLLVADAGNGRIRQVALDTGLVGTFAGGGATPADGPASQTAFAYPTAIAAAADGTVFVVDTGYGSVRRVDPEGQTTTLVSGREGIGHRDGPGDRARLSPQGGAIWADGALLIADPANFAVRRIVPGGDASSTSVETFAGGRFGAADGPGLSASFALPLGLASGGNGRVLVADPANGAIREIQP